MHGIDGQAHAGVAALAQRNGSLVLVLDGLVGMENLRPRARARRPIEQRHQPLLVAEQQVVDVRKPFAGDFNPLDNRARCMIAAHAVE